MPETATLGGGFDPAWSNCFLPYRKNCVFFPNLHFRRKNESINNLNLLSLLADRLLMNNRYLSLATYNALFEILTEYMTPEIQFIQHEDLPVDTVRFENPTLLKVIANLITQSENTEELMKVKKIFLEDMIRLCKDSKENRRYLVCRKHFHDSGKVRFIEAKIN
jgi:neurobeachin